MTDIEPCTPVLVGVGLVEQREQDPANAREAIALMTDAVIAAGRDSGDENLPAEAGAIYVPQGLWSYSNPAAMIAEAVGAERAQTVLAKIGILQQSPIDEACSRIAEGSLDVALVTGGEARYRALRASIAGLEVGEAPSGSAPDQTMEPDAELYHDVETAALGYMPVGYYAIIESAIRARLGLGVEQHRDSLAQLYSEFSAVAQANPHAWKRECLSPEMIRNPSERNPMLAFPYAKLHNTSWNVDQAAALLFCSASRAQALGIPRERWIFPQASAESNIMRSLAERPDLSSLPGAKLAGEAVLAHAGINPNDVDLIDLYSCFPAAVELYAMAIGLPLSGALTVTGGMPFAGGPLNNYVLQATGRMAQLLREGRGDTGLISTVSGLMTKQAFALWSRHAPSSPFTVFDVSREVAAQCPARAVVGECEGRATIIGYTVLYESGRRQQAVALLELSDGQRTLAISKDPELMQKMESEEYVGASVNVCEGGFVPVGE